MDQLTSAMARRDWLIVGLRLLGVCLGVYTLLSLPGSVSFLITGPVLGAPASLLEWARVLMQCLLSLGAAVVLTRGAERCATWCGERE